MPERASSRRERAAARGLPALSDAVSATGGIAVSLGVLLITIDIRADHPGRAAEAGLFAALVAAGYLAVLLLPAEIHPAGVAAVALGIPGALGWAILPGAHRFDDIRPFLIFTILAWLVAFAAPRIHGRPIFIALAALLLWLWILGEVAGTGAYSAAPIPSPPPHTIFSLQSFARGRSSVELGDLDANSPLYPLAQQCDDGNLSACDALYESAPNGSDFRAFASTCGNSQPNPDEAGLCEDDSGSGSVPFGLAPFSPVTGIAPTVPFTSGGSDKSLDIGLVSAFFGLAYLGALYALDRGRLRGLATAFVVPAVIALTTGTQALGSAAHHVWFGGALTFMAGLLTGLIGDRTERRFTTWIGGAIAALGGLFVALDSAHITRAVANGEVKLAGPGLIVISFGVGLIATAFVIAQLLRRPPPATPLTPPGFGAPAPDAPPVPATATAPTVWEPPASEPAPPSPWAVPPPPADPGPTWPPHQ